MSRDQIGSAQAVDDPVSVAPGKPSFKTAIWRLVGRLMAAIRREHPNTDSAGESSRSWHIDFKDVVMVLAIYSYFVGFLYMYFLYGDLGLPLMSLDIPVYYFFVYSYSVILDPRVLAVLLCAAALVFLVSAFAEKGSTVRTGTVIVVCSALFPILSFFARGIADADANHLRQGYSLKPISLSFKDTSPNRYPAELQDSSGTCQVYLLTENKDKVFLLCQPNPSRDVPGQLPIGHVYEVAKEDLSAIRVEIPDEKKR